MRKVVGYLLDDPNRVRTVIKQTCKRLNKGVEGLNRAAEGQFKFFD